MAVELDRPGSVESLYIARGEPVEPWRPIMSGDVFHGVQILGVPEHDLVMLISHPCSMRRGAGLLPSLQALPIRSYQSVALGAWSSGHFRALPLPALRQPEGTGELAAILTEIGMVPTSELDLAKRTACLSEKGIVLALQRFFHCLSRVRVGLDTLAVHAQAPLEEAALLEEWNETLAQAQIERGADQESVLAEEARQFEELLSSNPAGGSAPLRASLGIAAEQASVRRIVGRAIDLRQASLDPNAG